MTELSIEQLKDDLKSLQIVGYSQEAREAFWRLRANYARSARLAVTLHTQLHLEQEKRERTVKFLSAFSDGQALLRMMEAQEAALQTALRKLAEIASSSPKPGL